MKKIVLFIALIPTILCAQYSVQGTFSPASDYTYAFLYQSTPTGSDYINRSEIKADGSFAIQLDSTASAGIYKIVYALPLEENNFDLIYNGKEDVSLTFSLEKGLVFTNSNENKLWSSYTKSMELVNRTISNFYAKESLDKKGFSDIFKTLKDTQNAFEEASKGTMASVFIKANRPYIPEDFENVSTYSQHLKSNYLNPIDFSNPLLQSSDFLMDRVLAYVFGMSANTNDTIRKNDVDDLVVAIGEGNAIIKTLLLEMVWSRYTEQENEVVANYIADSYLMDLAKQINYSQLAEQLLIYKNNSKGQKALNFNIDLNTNGGTVTTSLHDLDISEQYLVIFWSSACSHCLEELPKVKNMLAKNSHLKVIAFGMEDSDENWKKEIAKFPDFIHVLGLQKWQNPIAKQYGVQSTPSFFLLDSDKHIIAKPYDADALKTLLE